MNKGNALSATLIAQTDHAMAAASTLSLMNSVMRASVESSTAAAKAASVLYSCIARPCQWSTADYSRAKARISNPEGVAYAFAQTLYALSTKSVSVCVLPRMFPEITDTAPNSPMARAFVRIVPYSSAHLRGQQRKFPESLSLRWETALESGDNKDVAMDSEQSQGRATP